MKRLLLILILFFTHLMACAQQPSTVDSLKKALITAKEDTNKVTILLRLAGSYDSYRVPDSVLLFARQAFQLATQLQQPEAIAYSKELMGGALWVMSDYLQADKYLTDAIKFWEAQHSPQVLGLYATISSNKRDHGAYREALNYCFKGDSLDRTFDTCKACGLYPTIIGSIYVEMNMPDSALYYLQKGHTEWDYTKWVIGRAYEEKGNEGLAFDYYRKSFSGLRSGYILKDLANLCSSLSQLFRRQGRIDSAIYYAKTGYDAAAKGSYIKGVWQLGLLLSDIYEPNDPAEALRYYKQAMAAKDKIVDIQKTTQVLNEEFNERLGQQQAEADRINYRNQTRMYLLLAALGFLLVLAIVLYRNNLQKQKANALLKKQKREIEKQNREANIEAALERVRAQTMAMRSSEEVSMATATMFTELENLGIKNYRGGILHIRKEQTMDVWSVNSLADGSVIRAAGLWDMTLHPWWRVLYKGWINKDEFLYYFLTGKEKEDYIRLLNARPDYLPKKIQELPDCHIQSYYFNEGAVWNFSVEPHSDEQRQIVKRFASVFSLTFRRYQDLRIAEAQAREAIKASSLDRIRAEIASMRTTSDLQRITPLIWNELTTLGVPFMRCGVFIMDDTQERVQIFLSSSDGRAIASFYLPYKATGPLHKVITQWHKNELHRDHWDEAALLEWTASLLDQGAIASKEQYLTEQWPTDLHLHFLPFLQGMLYVGSDVFLNEEDLQLVQSLADAFATAYARYEDFSKLELAKQRIETTLTELKATQAQLVQQEKMASLGELTAGIAHEIQNPLNFVNNFSEANQELVAELTQEAQAGNIEEVIAIAANIGANEERIAYHGKRADSIVKNMLQHSRASTGRKEPIDLNKLAEEYLRLSYQGMRARDNAFHVTIETHFDTSINEVPVVPQDIGRVLLNLFNNAFYAVGEKKGQLDGAFEPVVFVCTKRESKHVRIIVKDNGTGIPQKVADKVFQPFFTTKPTGRGTGLGLSLSYDIIIKGHGGTLSMQSTEGEGSEFVVGLPLV